MRNKKKEILKKANEGKTKNDEKKISIEDIIK
jgi:hypothetical protein